MDAVIDVKKALHSQVIFSDLTTAWQDIKMIVYKKGCGDKIVTGLRETEFKCKCLNDFCTATPIHPDLIKAYGTLRAMIAKPLTILSGYRCASHNFISGGSELSRHMTGQAIDIALDPFSHLDSDDLEHMVMLAGFTWYKFYTARGFMHLDVRK